LPLPYFLLCATGENDATGFIAGFWYGLIHGFSGVPSGHHTNLQFRDDLLKLASQLHEMAGFQE